ncbi:MAG TPA: hypothetical protein VLF43_01005 [Candidatus Saccharimonadales bacterium]|nr:hypothetical protein [Candidatus Saccharimonadales bacterium]
MLNNIKWSPGTFDDGSPICEDEYAIVYGDGRRTEFEPENLAVFEAPIAVDGIDKIILRGTYASQKDRIEPYIMPVVSLCSFDADDVLDVPGVPEVLITVQAFGYGYHPSYFGTKPDWYIVGDAVGQVDPQSGATILFGFNQVYFRSFPLSGLVSCYGY